jgi:serine/threonine-protein kinase
VSIKLLRRFLEEEAPQRELAVVRVVAPVACVCLALLGLQAPFIGWETATLQAPVLVVLATHYVGLWFVLRRGQWHWSIPWVNVFIETSILTVILWIQAAMRGPEYALTSSLHTAWGALIMLSAIRARQSLSIAAGAVAGLEYYLLYFLYMAPRLPERRLITLTFVGIGMRGFYLFISGVAAAAVAKLLVDKAEMALRAVREKDLMSKYFLHERLGAGGMAEVFRATYSPEGGFEKTVAVKRVRPELSSKPEFTEMFRGEARLCASLSHPNVIQVFDIGRFDGHTILAMEYVDGLSLNKILRNRREPLPLCAVTYLAHELACALDYLHGKLGPDGKRLGLVHFDVNPPNILVSRLGEVKLADFGVARAASRTPGEDDGIVRGKAGYLAPEQLRFERADGRADLYCLGLTLHESLTGRRLYSGETREILERSLANPIPLPSSYRQGVPQDLEAAILKLLERSPQRRFQTGAELRIRMETMVGDAAPFPHGQGELARAVTLSLHPRASTTEATVPLGEAPGERTEPVDGPRTRPIRKP